MLKVLREIRIHFQGWKFFFLKSLGYRPDYLKKESYISPNPDPNWWEKHINYMQLQQYSKFLKGDVADLGCNHGATTLLATRLPELKSITGVDINPGAIAAATALAFQEREPNWRKAKFKVSNFLKIDLASDSLDAVYTFHSIEHIRKSEHRFVIKEVHRVIKPGGYVLAVVPHKYAYFDATHEVAFSLNSFRKLFANNGFKVLECYRDRRVDAYAPDGHDAILLLAQK